MSVLPESIDTSASTAAGIRPAVLSRRRRFPWLPLLVLSAVVVIFGFVIAEIGLRIGELRASNLVGLQCVGSATQLQGQKGLYTLDDAAGYRMRPNTCVRLRSTEYDGVLRTNSAGMVGPQLSGRKPDGEFRIVVLGDSYAVGGQVPYDHTFPAVLERRLREAGHANVRVLDAAVGGYTTFNEAGLLREQIGSWQPDLVVVAAFLGNDISENVLATAAGYREAPEHPKGVTWGQAAGRLVDDSGGWFPRNHLSTGSQAPPPWSPLQPLPTAVGNQPFVAVSAADGHASGLTFGESVRRAGRGVWDGARANSLVLGRLFGVPVDPSVTTAPGAAPVALEQKRLNLTSFEWSILRDIPRTYWLDVAWPLFGEYLADIRATASPAPVILLTIPEMAQFDEQMQARTMQAFRFTADEVDWDRPQRDLASQAGRVGLPELDLLPLFRARADRDRLYLRVDTHFSTLGHQATADALAEFLQAGGWVR